MKRTAAFFLLFWTGLLGMPGCDNCVCPKDVYADINGLIPFTYKRTSGTAGLSSVSNNERLSWNEIARFSVSYAIRTYGNLLRQREFPTSWGRAAYACDCNPPGYLGTQEKLKSMTIRTAFDFDATHPAGSVLNEFTTVTVNSGANGVPLNAYLSKGLVAYQEGNQFNLVLTQAPSAKGPFALDITVELDNGEVYSTRTPVVELI